MRLPGYSDAFAPRGLAGAGPKSGESAGGLLLTIVLGIAGALLGGFLSVALGVGDGVDDFDIGTIFLSVVGAIILLALYRAVFRREA